MVKVNGHLDLEVWVEKHDLMNPGPGSYFIGDRMPKRSLVKSS